MRNGSTVISTVHTYAEVSTRTVFDIIHFHILIQFAADSSKEIIIRKTRRGIKSVI